MSEIQIVDIIDHRNKYATQVEVVLSRFPEPLFDRRGGWLIGEDSGVFRFYGHERVEAHWPSNWKAFGGSEIEIPMADGTVIHANGQWWDSFPADFQGLVYSCGMNTAERLAECYVFMGGFHIDCALVDEWRKHNEPSNNYHKYDPKHETFGVHRIVSPWEPVEAT